MPAFVRNHAVTLLVFAVSLVLSWLLLARLAAADIDAGQMVPVATMEPLDAGQALPPAPAIDRVVAADHASPAADPGAYQAPPPPAPPGMSAETLTWGYLKAGGGASVAMRFLFWVGTALLASKERLAQRWPKLATGRNLAIVSSVVGAMLTLGRGAALSGAALSGAPLTWLALGEAVMSAILLVTWPQPKIVAGQTVPGPVPAP